MAGVVDSFVALVRRVVGLPEDPGQPPDIMRLGLYPARVDSCSSDGTKCDVTPADTRISKGEKNVEVLVGIPGATAVVEPGAIVLLGWRRGDPASPYCMPAWASGAVVDKVVFTDAANDSISISNGTITATNGNNDSISISGGNITVKSGGVTVIQASASSLKLGLIGTFPVLVQGTVDSLGVPVTQNPAATATIVRAG